METSGSPKTPLRAPCRGVLVRSWRSRSRSRCWGNAALPGFLLHHISFLSVLLLGAVLLSPGGIKSPGGRGVRALCPHGCWCHGGGKASSKKGVLEDPALAGRAGFATGEGSGVFGLCGNIGWRRGKGCLQ